MMWHVDMCSSGCWFYFSFLKKMYLSFKDPEFKSSDVQTNKKKRKRNTEETKSVSLTKLLINTSLCVYDSHFLRWSGQVRPWRSRRYHTAEQFVAFGVGFLRWDGVLSDSEGTCTYCTRRWQQSPFISRKLSFAGAHSPSFSSLWAGEIFKKNW